MICHSRCGRDGLKSPVWIPGWGRTLHRAVGRAVNDDKPSAPALNAVIDDIFGQVSRAIKREYSCPAAFDLLPQVLSRQFDNGDAAPALRELHNFGVPNGTTSAACYRSFRLDVSVVTGSERAFAPGLGLVLEIVRYSVNEQFPQLMPILLATRPRRFDLINAIALGALANNKTPAINSAKLFSSPAVSEGRVSAPSGPPRAAPGRGRGREASQTSVWATDSQLNPVVMNASQDPTDPWVSSTSYPHWPLAH